MWARVGIFDSDAVYVVGSSVARARRMLPSLPVCVHAYNDVAHVWHCSG